LKSAVITCYFNAEGYASRRLNYDLFAARLKKQKVPLYTIEAIFPGQRSALTGHANVMTVECGAVLWQKESLLNLLIRSLDVKYRGIIWCDADVYFQNPDWFRQTSRLLGRFPIVQPFTDVARLPRGARRYLKSAESFRAFASVYSEYPQLLLRGDFAAHGHTGFVWAARREILETHGLYDAMIAGSGDHAMAHAFAGDFSSACVGRILGDNPRQINHFRVWARQVYPDVRARIGAVPGRILHLWHGEAENRRYVLRNRELAALRFDPERDLVRDSSGLWNLNSRGMRLSGWAKSYFAARREDG
jgi:hypothetical protein